MNAPISAPSLQSAPAPAPTHQPLWLGRLTLSDFRPHERAEMEADSRPVVLTGANGGGKTSLLEAISFLSPGRGLRRAPQGEAARRDGGGGWTVSAILRGSQNAPDALSLGTGLRKGGGARRTRIGGKAAGGPLAFGRILRLLWITPAMDRLFSEGAAERLRFLDRIVTASDPAHAARAASYERAKRERQRLLRERLPDPAWLDSLERTMSEDAVALARSRFDFLEALAREMPSVRDAGFPEGACRLEGFFEDAFRRDPKGAEGFLRERLARARGEDARSRRTLWGPHRARFSARHIPAALDASLASAGEQKALLLSVILGAARFLSRAKSEAPLLLLDEALIHLDKSLRAALFEALLAMRLQAWMTGTDAEPFAPLSKAAQFFTVAPSAVIRVA